MFRLVGNFAELIRAKPLIRYLRPRKRNHPEKILSDSIHFFRALESSLVSHVRLRVLCYRKAEARRRLVTRYASLLLIRHRIVPRPPASLPVTLYVIRYNHLISTTCRPSRRYAAMSRAAIRRRESTTHLKDPRKESRLDRIPIFQKDILYLCLYQD